MIFLPYVSSKVGKDNCLSTALKKAHRWVRTHKHKHLQIRCTLPSLELRMRSIAGMWSLVFKTATKSGRGQARTSEKCHKAFLLL
jgi:hypothetical protein